MNIPRVMQADNETIADLEHIAATLSVAHEQAKALEQHLAELESRIRLARGTGDVSEAAAAAVAQTGAPEPEPTRAPAPKKPETVRDRVTGALRRESLTLSQLAKAVGASAGPTAEALKAMRKENAVFNVGSAEYPIWTFRIGDATPTPELAATIRRLISERPMTTRELMLATGARMSRVSGCLVHLQRTEKGLRDMGTPRRARWFLVSGRGTHAKLEPKVTP